MIRRRRKRMRWRRMKESEKEENGKMNEKYDEVVEVTNEEEKG